MEFGELIELLQSKRTTLSYGDLKYFEEAFDERTFAYESWSQEKKLNWCLQNDVPAWEEVEQFGGEGMGDNWYSVKYFPSLDMYVKISTYYQSYSDIKFDDFKNCCRQVTPVERTVTFYE